MGTPPVGNVSQAETKFWGYLGVEQCPPQIAVHWGPVKVTSFRNKVFADGIKTRPYWVRVA